jgi:hypothetical protein
MWRWGSRRGLKARFQVIRFSSYQISSNQISSSQIFKTRKRGVSYQIFGLSDFQIFQKGSGVRVSKSSDKFGTNLLSVRPETVVTH